jgi:hypothetical protein
MILPKEPWERRAAANDVSDVVVDLFATELEGETEHGTYIVQRAGADWCVKFRAVGARLDQRDLSIDALDEHGNHLDWPSRGYAAEAVNLHARLMALGYGVHRAIEKVAERSQRVTGTRPVLAYGQVKP